MNKQRFRSLCAALLTVLMVFCLVACTGNGDGGETTTTTTTAGTEENSTTSSTVSTSSSDGSTSASDPTSSSSVSNSTTTTTAPTTKPNTGDTRTYYMKDATGNTDRIKFRSLINQVRQENLVAQGQGKTVNFVIAFEKKTYSFDDTIILTMNDNLTVEGNGATFIVTQLKTFLNISNSQNVTFRNFSVDYNPMTFTQGTVTAINGKTVTFTVDTGYSTDPKILNYGGSFQCQVHDSKTGALATNSYSTHSGTNAKNLGGQKMSVEFNNVADVKVGSRVSFHYRGSGAILSTDTKNLTYENVNLYASPGFGIVGSEGYGNTVLKNVKIVPGAKPAGATQDRLISVNGDATHFAEYTVGPTVDGCRFTHMTDDGINVQGFYSHIIGIEGNTIYVSPKNSDIKYSVGETLEFSEKETYVGYATAKITTIEQVTASKYSTNVSSAWSGVYYGPTNAYAYKMTLSRPVSALGIKVLDHVTSKDRECAGTTIKNSFYGYNRARGIVLKCPNAKVLNTTVTHTSESGIMALPDLAWAESSWARNLEISGCTVTNCALAKNPHDGNDQIGSIMVGVVPLIGRSGFMNSYGNTNITIKNNTVTDSHVFGISVTNADGVTITGNKIINPLWDGKGKVGSVYGLTADAGIFVGKSKNVTVTGNTITKKNAAVKQAVQIHSTVSGTQTVSGNTLG